MSSNEATSPTREPSRAALNRRRREILDHPERFISRSIPPAEMTTAQREQLELFENEGAIFRGLFRHFPLEVWSTRQQVWVPYEGQVPKPEHWGYPITEEDAQEYMKPW